MNKEVLEGNKLIAIFMGGRPYYLDANVITFPMMENPAQSINNTTTHHADKLQYHTSWDWLRPAWEKFMNLKVSGVDEPVFDTHRQSVAYAFAWYEISVAHDRLVRAINWRNNQTQKR